MAKLSPDKIRAFAVVGHSHSGKTSLLESMLFCAGASPRLGRVDDGSSRLDYDPEEITRKMTINLTPATFTWKDTEFHAVDCPGFPDFAADSKAALNATDSALLVVSAQAGCEAQTEKAVEAARDLGRPVLAVVSKMDKDNADFDKAVHSLEDHIGGHFIPVWIPIGAASGYQGFVDLLAGKAFYIKEDGAKVEEKPIPDAMGEAVAKYREKLIEAAIEIDDKLTERYLAGESISDAEMRKVAHEAIVTSHFVPVFCAAALTNMGTRQLLDALVAYEPTAEERKHVELTPDGKELEYKVTAEGDPLAYCFKVLHESHVGDVALVRVFSGTFTRGMAVLNSTRNVKDKVGNLFRLVGKERTEVDELTAGQVGAIVKLQSVHANESLCSEKKPLLHPKIEYPDPTISAAIKPATQADQEKLANILTKINQEDPNVRAYPDPVTHEIIFSAAGDVQLDILIHRLKAKNNINLDAHKPKIPYRETVRGKAEAEGKVKKQSGGHGQFAIVNLRVEPLPGKGFEFVDAIVGGVVPRNFIPAVEKGLRESLPKGVIAGYPVTDVRVTLYFGKYHDVDSSEMAFKTAASLGFRDAVKAAKPVLLEPVMKVLITVPEASMGDIIGDLNHRRGRVQGMDPLGKKTRINALVPLSELYRYITTLRSMTGGRGEFVMTLDHYDEVPPNLAKPIIDEYAKHATHEEH